MKIAFLLYRRNIKSTLPVFVLNLLVLSLIGIVAIATAFPYGIQAIEELEELPVDLFASISQRGMRDVSFVDLEGIFNSLSLEEGNIEFCIVISLSTNILGEKKRVPYIALSEGLLNLFEIESDGVVGSPELGVGDVALNPVNDTGTYDLNVPQTKDLNVYEIFSDLRIITYQNLLSYKYQSGEFNPRPASFLIVGNTSLGFSIIESLNISSGELGAIVLGFYQNNWTNDLTFEDINAKITKDEKEVFQELISHGIDPERISFSWSPTRFTLFDLSLKIKGEIMTTQRLGILNVVFVLFLVFNVDFSFYSVIRKDGKILCSRGIKTSKLKFMFLSLEVITDLLSLITAQAFFSSIVFFLKLHPSFYLRLFSMFALVTCLIILAKAFRFLTIKEKRFFDDIKMKDEKREDSYSRMSVFAKYRHIIYGVLITTLILRICIIFEPLFWYPVFTNIVRYIFDGFTYIVIITVFLSILYSTNTIQKIKSQSLNYIDLVKRLFKSGLKKISIQRIVTVGLYTLVIYLILYQISSQNLNNAKNENYMIYDISITPLPHLSFNLEDVMNLKESIPNIKEIYPIVNEIGNIIDEENGMRLYIGFFNGSLYFSKEVGWNHFIGESNNSDVLTKVTNETIIIRQNIADEANLRLGDIVSLDIRLINIVDETKIVRVNNLTVIGIVDVLPISGGVYSNAFLDISLLFQVLEEQALERRITEVNMDLKFEENSNSTEQESIREQTINLILSELNTSMNQVHIRTKDITYSYYHQYRSTNFFIIFDTVLAIFFLPLITIIFSRAGVKAIAPSLLQIGTRGLSDKVIRKNFSKEVYLSIISSIFIGVIMGVLLILIKMQNSYPSMLLAADSRLHLQLISYTLGILSGGILISIIIIPFSVNQIKTIVDDRMKERFKDELH